MSIGSNLTKRIVAWICVSVAPIAYYTYLHHLALDVPAGDDFVVILNYLLCSDADSTWADKWHELTFQFIEHRLVFTRLTAQFIRGLEGKLDFSHIMLMGNLCLLGVVGLIYRTLRANELSVWYLLPVTLIVFQPIAYEGHFWAISSTNYMPVCLFALLAFNGLSRGTLLSLTYAWLMAIAATFTFANGLLVWPIGALMLLNQRKQILALWTASAGFFVAVYYYGHNYRPHPSMIDNLHERFPTAVTNFFLLLGACFNPNDTTHSFTWTDLPALATGITITLIFLVSCLHLVPVHKRLVDVRFMNRLITIKHGPFLLGTALFLLFSCMAFGAGRSIHNTVITDSRYRDFSVFATALTYCFVLLALVPSQRRWYLTLSTGASLFFCVSSYALYTPRLLAQNANIKAGAYNWHHNRHWLIYRPTAYMESVANKVSADMEKVTWYSIPYYAFNPSTVATNYVPAPTLIDAKKQIAYWRLPVDPIGSDQPYFCLYNGGQTYLLAIARPTGLTNWWRTGRTLGHYFITDFSYGRSLPEGQWTIDVCLEKANKRLRFLPKLVLKGSIDPFKTSLGD